MSEFKLLAIRPLEGCDPGLLKNLKEGLVYKFYQEIEVFVNPDEEVELDNENYDSYKQEKISRVSIPENSIDLYSGVGPKINISAVVGKNGSGKSAITEIFLKAMFDLAIENKIITQEKLDSQFAKEREFIESQIEQIELSLDLISRGEYDFKGENFLNKIVELGAKLSNYYKRIKNSDDFTKKLDNYTDSALYFELIGQFANGKPFIIRKRKGDKRISIDENEGNHQYKDLFYTIFLNYSIYGLNAYEIGDWIDFLYHKNDGYQTPVVINPQKTDGNIDVNTEEELSQYRINRSAVSNGKIIDLEIKELKFDFKQKRYNYRFEYDWDTDTLYADNKPKEPGFKFESTGKSESEFLKKVSGSKSDFKSNDFPIVLVKYFLGKLFKSDYLYGLDNFTYDAERSMYKLTNLSTYCQETICKSTSHKLLKLRQVIDILRTKIELAEELFEYSNNKEWIQFPEFKKKLNKKDDIDLQISFSSIFNVDYKFKDGSTYSKFSSGQKQFVNTLETINYHIKNLVSNNEYKAINIILDEVELYFHPDYQRVLIQKMIDSIGALNLTSDYSINVLFLTHSPFILSDIPSSNILKLKDGKPQLSIKQTFAANIYDLLKDDFFLDDGVIGEFASETIQKVLNNELNNYDDSLEIIELIGDPLLKSVVYEKVIGRIRDEKVLQEQIDKLNERLNNIKNVPNKRV